MSNVIKKKVLVVSTQDYGGAGECMLKFAYFLKELGHNVIYLVKDKSKSDEIIYQYYEPTSWVRQLFIFLKEKIKNRIYQDQLLLDEKHCFFSLNENKTNIDTDLIQKLLNFKPELIFSGWTAGFMNSTDLLNLQRKFGSQIYTVSTDMNHYTGGCHYSWDCKGYINGCNDNCPAILSDNHKKIAKINFETKLNNAKAGNFKIISGSGWTLKQSKESLIYKDQADFFNINSLIDTKLMNSKNREFAKDIFNFDKNKFYILMGCQNTNDPRKGFEYLLESLNILYKKLSDEQTERIRVLIVSKNKNQNTPILFKTTHIDYITDYRLLSLLYQASDVFVNSSIEDSGPMMVSEALACGTPVVGFDMGVVNNLVINNFNGYKAILRDSEDLAKGIKTIFDLSPEQHKWYSDNSFKQIEEFSSFKYATKLITKIMN